MSASVVSPYACLLLIFLFVYFLLYPLVEYFRDKHGNTTQDLPLQNRG